MRLYTLVALLIVVVLTLDAIGECEGWWGSRGGKVAAQRASRSVRRRVNVNRNIANKNRYHRNKARLSKVRKQQKNRYRGTRRKVGRRTSYTRARHFLKVRDRNETGHRTGLGTLRRKLNSQPRKTLEQSAPSGNSSRTLE